MTQQIARVLAANWKLLPVAGMLLIWFFFSGFRAILRTRTDRLVREVLLCFAVFGFLYALLCFSIYGLVDPLNHFARSGAPPVSPDSMARFATMAWASLFVGLLAGGLLEWRMRRE